MWGPNKIFLRKVVGEYEFYLVDDLGTAEINGKPTYDFSACAHIKSVTDKIENIFETTLKNYESPLEGGYHTEVEKSDILVGGKYQGT